MPDLLPCLIFPDLLTRASEAVEGWSALFPGVWARWLYRTDGGPAAAVLRYEPGASVPAHEHLGYEHVFVLQGSQADERGHYPAGTLAVNPPGSTHAVTSDEGCVVLIVWERPVRFLVSPPAPP